MNTLNGKLIVIEGTDGSGKETQALRLRDELWSKGIACKYFSFPRYDTPTGEIIKMYLGKPPYDVPQFGPPNEVDPRLASSLYALDRQAAGFEIKSSLAKGIPVICNRYVESNMAHQGGKLKDPKERAGIIHWLEDLEYNKMKLPRANKVFFLYMPNSVASELRKDRGQLDGHESDPNHMINAERTYIELAERFGWTRINCAPDGTRSSLRSIEDIGDEVCSIVEKDLQNA